jgi:predicted metalloprotease with PDZ domain
MNESGTVEDVAIDGPAQKAGMAPAVQVIAVNGRQYNSTILREAVSKSTATTDPLDLLIKDGDYYRTVRVDYHGGERYPQLERDESKPDVLSLIIAAKAKK